MSIQFRHIARAVVVSDGQILIARMKGAHSFLPGGGVEHGEGAVTALKRELREELGVTAVEVVRFLGVVEFGLEHKQYHEINHVFEVRCEELRGGTNPKSQESHLEFYWTQPTAEKLKEHDVLPYLVQEMIPEALREGRPLWVSNMSGEG
ncbi:NUDIX domain-containing protein [Paenibacillus ginsengarvi]|uniref:NUDIX domain-containing protein n=1 Tax=Paenibacillus ginsengarvi TaxID=400777 RepID=A0A3B0BFX6_9BACL|nr:NUDIX domain-containing protein [Paenibacillus ginsengarvi]RKN71214.1 NUDIX domain-containing protein [Paenibacillus ginsengarvi]